MQARCQECIEQRDATAAADVLDDDYQLVLVHPARLVVSRDRWLETLDSYVVSSYEVDEQLVDVDGDCAAILQRVRMSATVFGQDRSSTFVITDLWRRRSDGWRIWRRHSTPLTAGDLPGA